MKNNKPLTAHSYIHIRETGEVLDFEKLTPEERKDISQRLNEQAARTIVLTCE